MSSVVIGSVGRFHNYGSGHLRPLSIICFVEMHKIFNRPGTLWDLRSGKQLSKTKTKSKGLCECFETVGWPSLKKMNQKEGGKKIVAAIWIYLFVFKKIN